MYGSLLCQCKDSSTNYFFFQYYIQACFDILECDGGKYGQNCSKACGFCSESQQCDTKKAPVKMDVRMVTSVICAQKVIIRIFFLLSHGKQSVSSNMTIN